MSILASMAGRLRSRERPENKSRRWLGLLVSSAFTALFGALFFWSLRKIQFETEEHAVANFLLDWARFLFFLGFIISAGVTVYRSFCRSRPLAQNIFVSVSATVVALLLFETGLRLTTPQFYWYGRRLSNYAKGCVDFDPVIGWVGAPHAKMTHHDSEFNVRIRHNSLGFRDDEPADAPTTVPRVLFLGDSFSWGWGVAMENRFDRRAQWHLQHKGITVETLDGGTEAYSTDQEYLLLQRVFPSYQPRIVVLQYCVNDLNQNNTEILEDVCKPYFTLDNGTSLVLHAEHVRLIPPPAPPPQGRLVKALQRVDLGFRQFSHAYRFLNLKLIYRNVPRSNMNLVPSGARGEAPNNMDDWRLTLALIRAIHHYCREHGAQMILLITPERVRVHWTPCWYFREVLIPFCKQEGISYIDLHRPEEGKPFDFKRNSYALDGHWNRRGHDVAGRAVADVIAQGLRRHRDGEGGEPRIGKRGAS